MAMIEKRIRRLWSKWLNRRTRGKTLTWDVYQDLLDRLPLLPLRITRPWEATSSILTSPALSLPQSQLGTSSFALSTKYIFMMSSLMP
jgi:hypothetical protein